MLSTVARHTFPSLFPLVLPKLNGLCFKNAALSKTPLKLSPLLFFSLSLPPSPAPLPQPAHPVELLCSPDKYYVSFGLRRYRGAFGERLVRSNPVERSEKGKMLVSISSEMRRGSVRWTQMLFQHAPCAFPPASAPLPDRHGLIRHWRRFLQAALQMTLLHSSTCVLLLLAK